MTTPRTDAPAASASPPEAGRFRPRRLAGLLRPRTVEEVVGHVRAAARAARPSSDGGGSAPVPLHPVSTGRNWGLGSALPVRDGAAVLDLSGLDRIREIDALRGYAVVEPGVTQDLLAQRLTGTDRVLNLTGASRHTSIIGNLLERGVGLHRTRAEDLAGLELVLADGQCVRTGWWPVPDGPAVVHPHGSGPSLNHLFTQASWAAVTAAVVRLRPRPRTVAVLPLTFPPDRLTAAVDVLREWTAGHLVPATTKIYDPVAARTYGVRDRYLAHVCLTGDPEVTDALARVVGDRVRAPGSPFEHAPPEAADADVHAAYAGWPDPADTLFRRKTGGCCARCLDRERGLLMFLPLVPFRGTAVAEAAGLVRGATADAAAPGITMNVLDADTVDHVVTIGFAPGDPVAARRAHRTLDGLHTAFAARGWLPYRPDVDHPLPAPHTVLHRRLRDALDPHGVFARGRFEGPRPPAAP
ncbi:FAD-binding oxidoreductase [Streptomyces sp. NPDC058682]|uniref:FAD-binding oxidoreductase n=1 Tax=unclassified Streptomyces TaxID=2593676 RepID=UPI0022508D3D|nr:FAD-binding oxidoreductase [Streptomyces sp. NBC_01214]MCX4802449.1 FAD-binding oxidoreductase [Streptomyces sp. NBC_01214]